MALTISILFLSGRAHLHHWQAHHSDGKVDWPPSPWRLLRALVAVAGRGMTSLPDPDFIEDPGKKPKASKKNPLPEWPPKNYNALPDNWFGTDWPTDDMVPVSRLSALLVLLAPAPEIWLPKTSGGHTRQFFAIHEGGRVKNSGSAVFDTFAVVPKDQPLLFHWPELSIGLDDPRLEDLRLILHRMTYFGRAESWCHAEVLTREPQKIKGIEKGKTHWPCICIEDGCRPEGQEHRDYILDRKLAALAMNQESESDLASEALSLFPRTKKISAKRPKKDFELLLQHEAEATLLLRCLMRESGQDMKDGLERPIGSRWVHYAVPREIYDLPNIKLNKHVNHKSVQIVRYSLNTASIHRQVLPPLTDALLVADKFRSASLALHFSGFHDGRKSHARNLLGREADNSICQNHNHAFFWPTDEDNDGFIDHVTVYCPYGFEPHEIDALRRLCRLHQRGGRPDLLVTPIYVGNLEEFRLWSSIDENGNDQKTQVFVSATPYFCPVHLTHGRGSSGRARSVTVEMIKGMKSQSIITNDADIVSIDEIVFDYDPRELTRIHDALSAKQVAEPVPPRQYFPVVQPSMDYPPLAQEVPVTDVRFSGAFLKNPDSGFPFGLSVGLLANKGTRFIRAMSFCRRRRHHELKGHGRMFRIEFSVPREPRPFAIGDQCHFGLGLFTPVTR